MLGGVGAHFLPFPFMTVPFYEFEAHTHTPNAAALGASRLVPLGTCNNMGYSRGWNNVCVHCLWISSYEIHMVAEQSHAHIQELASNACGKKGGTRTWSLNHAEISVCQCIPVPLSPEDIDIDG
jgi:hypothetical protein